MLAAGLAYFAFTSLVPVVLLGVMLISSVGEASVVDRVISVATTAFGEPLGSALANAVFTSEVHPRTTVVAVAVLIWSALRLFSSSDRAFAAIYDDRDERSLLTSVRHAILVFVTNLVALTLLGGIVVLLGAAPGPLAVLAPIALLAVLVIVFLPMFYVFPRPDVSLLEVLPGTVFAAGTWAVASALIGVYAGTSGSRLFGAANGLLLVFTWLYVGSLGILFGATLNAVLGGHVEPDGEWVPTAYM